MCLLYRMCALRASLVVALSGGGGGTAQFSPHAGGGGLPPLGSISLPGMPPVSLPPFTSIPGVQLPTTTQGNVLRLWREGLGTDGSSSYSGVVIMSMYFFTLGKCYAAYAKCYLAGF